MKDLQNLGGTIRFTAPIAQNQAINGGFSFDMPLNTIAAFQNQALTFAQGNSARNQGFLQNIQSTAQSSIDNISNQFFAQQEKTSNFMSNLTSIFDQRTDQAIRSSKPRGCFITTAWAETVGENFKDDCDELETLRAFRDGFMCETPERKADVQEYYERAPVFLDVLRANALSGDEFDEFMMYLGDTYIKPAVAQIKEGDNHGAYETYKNLYEFVRDVVADLTGE